jgi:hypothetical protein
MIFPCMSCQEIMQIQGVHPALKKSTSIYLVVGCFACNPHTATTTTLNFYLAVESTFLASSLVSEIGFFLLYKDGFFHAFSRALRYCDMATRKKTCYSLGERGKKRTLAIQRWTSCIHHLDILTLHCACIVTASWTRKLN